ncbi:8-amino-7-oxononanoate synthase [Candidatus Synechococcus calcipolaris G9]|uniref:8-amino-7-ketopelargonate synthase n=1 Tax=Candidatus Synechococcus calcipolaris G9 TaxID=1497997 RepID=A0ABT6F3H4_9SYNE|nr:8-amino-7-oxononanoate synthase [Candidatus Synechococcus calcipolaris]MDG2992421.1 8-amino-7-oxononanoate synthase [Candidatus Synechococcus calcipolaris G9]
MQDPYDWLAPALKTIHRAHWYRQPQCSTCQGAIAMVQGRELINFASNNYLGLANHPEVIQAGQNALEIWGTGATGSRLLTGHRQIHQELEQALATFKGTEAALVFSSGYLANLGAIAAVVDQRDLILGDRYNHSSLKNGAKLSGAKTIDYPHLDIAALEQLLHHHRHQYRRCLIVTDSLFSMDGDLAPIPKLLKVAQDFQAMVLVDEAHATGVFGPRGSGWIEQVNCSGQPLIQVGTLSKALGSLGGYVAGSQMLIEFIRHRAATWVYSTALSPADTAAALAALNVIQNNNQPRENLWQRIDQLHHGLKKLDRLHNPSLTPGIPSPIVCLTAPDAQTALAWSRTLGDLGLWVSGIRPPTVPHSRLRISLMANHTKAHIEALLAGLEQLLPSGGTGCLE